MNVPPPLEISEWADKFGYDSAKLGSPQASLDEKQIAFINSCQVGRTECMVYSVDEGIEDEDDTSE